MCCMHLAKKGFGSIMFTNHLIVLYYDLCLATNYYILIKHTSSYSFCPLNVLPIETWNVWKIGSYLKRKAGFR